MCGRILAALALVLAAGCGGMQVKESKMADCRMHTLENRFYSSVWVFDRAALPLTYTSKLTDNDFYLRRDTLEDGLKSFDGIVDCLPWVGGKGVPAKALLPKADWSIEREDDACGSVRMIGTTEIEYRDAVAEKPSRLRFRKTVRAAKDTSQIRMDYEIVNVGDGAATFTITAHGRVAPGGTRTEGDYFYAPGDRCWIGEQLTWEALIERGFALNTWQKWPIPEATRFQPNQPGVGTVYAWIPTRWSAMGDPATGDAMVFWNTPLTIGGAEQDLYTCFLRRKTDFLVEICGSRSLRYYENKDMEGALLTLAPKETCSFTICLAAYEGLNQPDFATAESVEPGYIVIETPAIAMQDGALRLSGRLMACGSLNFRLLQRDPQRDRVLHEWTAGPGLIDLSSIAPMSASADRRNLILSVSDMLGHETSYPIE